MRSPTSTRTSPGRRITAALLGIITALALAVPAAVAGPTDDPDTAAALGGGSVARLVADDGSVEEGISGPVGNATQAALGLAASGTGQEAFTRALAYVAANVQEYTGPCDATTEETDPGALGFVLLLADAAGEDPRDFGGEDLVMCLQETRRSSGPDEGLYGESSPNFDGTFRQSIALLALAASEVTPDVTAVQWLQEQQCGSGGWPSYRPDTTVECGPEGAFDPTAPNTNSTGLAVQALVALSEPWAHEPGPYLQGAQSDDGGFGYDSASATDANSTALVIQAIVALGQDPTVGTWQQDDGDTPLTALLSLQLGCEAAGPDRGAFAYQPDENGDLQANAYATYQGIWGAARAPLPFGTVELDTGDPFPDCPLEVVREAGETRIGTAIDVAGSSHPDGADTVVIAHAYGYADALAGAPLARLEDAPILFSDRDALPAEVADAVNELGATEAILLGGEAALSAQVADDLREQTDVETIERIDGSDRFDTAARIAERVGGEDVYVVEGADPDPTRGWPDALAVGPVAAHQQRPILLVTTDTLPDRTRAALESKASATIVGGTAAVSADVAAAVDEEVGEVDRVAGADRYRTAAAVTEVARAAGMDPTTTWFATGRRFADALAAAPAVAKAGAVFMLVDGEDYANSPATDDYIHAVDHTLDVIVIAGGRLAITAGVQDAIETAAREQALQ